MSAEADLVPPDLDHDPQGHRPSGFAADRSRPRPRILHVCTRFGRGGSEQRLRDIVSAASDWDHEVILGGDSDVGLLRDQLPTVQVSQEPSLRREVRPAQDLTAFLRLRRAVRDGGYDAVVTHQSKAGVLGRMAATSAGRPPIVHSLSMADFGPGYGRLENRLFRVLERQLERWTDAYVVVGADLADRFARLGVPPEKLSVVRSGVRLPSPLSSRSEARRRVARRFALPLSRPWILYVGSLDERKNVLALPILLQQALQLAAHTRPFLIIAGEGPSELQLRSLLVQMGLERDSRLLGFVEDPSTLFGAAEAVVLLSRSEGLPQVLVQAAAVGTPFVATATDGADELLELGASGTVVENNDIVGATRALLPYLRWPVQDCEPNIDLDSWQEEQVRAQHRAVLCSVMAKSVSGLPSSGSIDGDRAASEPGALAGAVVALIGSDGSGKSTISRALVEAFAPRQTVLHLYMGSGDGPSSVLRWPMKRARAALFGTKGATTRKEAVERRAPKALRVSRPLWALALAREKQGKLRRAWRARSHGVLVICDRYPQAQVPGQIDGPRLDHWASSPRRWQRAIARWEAKPYQRAHHAQPDLVLRLAVDQQVVEERRAGHDPTDLDRRRRLVEALAFDNVGLGLVEIDANRSLDDVLQQAVAAIEKHLGPSHGGDRGS